ncbi:reverse transcriptase family protein [Shewanella baltica]|uniref:reverse transcriptase family protein n=1 Tax=Shewanella baltica TaxID=62322 RepID=UPI003D7B3812
MKINKKFFLEELGLQDTKVLPIDNEVITNIKLGKKFAYCLNKKVAKTQEILKTHNKLSQLFLKKIEINKSATAFIKGKSYLDFLEPHRNNFHFIRIDLKNFFHSINESLLYEAFKGYFTEEYLGIRPTNQKLIDAFINLVTYIVPSDSIDVACRNKVILPMGFKLSPIISNIVFRMYDILIEDYCYKNDITYTRYADDMIFSMKPSQRYIEQKKEKNNITSMLFKPINSDDIYKNSTFKNSCYIHTDKFLDEIQNILSINNKGKFLINTKKTVMSNHTISLNGYVIEDNDNPLSVGTIRLSNKKTLIISKVIHALKNNLSSEYIMTKILKISLDEKRIPYFPASKKFSNQYYKDQLKHTLLGYRSYLFSFIVYNKKTNCIEQKYINKYILLINEIEKNLHKV